MIETLPKVSGKMMKDDILIRINNCIKVSQAIPKSQHKADFFAHKEDIIKAMVAGHNVTIIWKTLRQEEKITMEYRTFKRNVQLYIKKALEEKQRASLENVPKDLTPEKKPTSKKGFNWDPNLNLEDLI